MQPVTEVVKRRCVQGAWRQNETGRCYQYSVIRKDKYITDLCSVLQPPFYHDQPRLAAACGSRLGCSSKIRMAANILRSTRLRCAPLEIDSK